MYAKKTGEFNEAGYELLLSAGRKQALRNLVRNGDPDKKQRMIDHNLRLVVRIARKYTNRGVALSDLIREGNLGLIYALEKLEVKSDSCFLTVATQCISQYMLLAIMKQNLSSDSFLAKPAHVLTFDNPAHERRV